MHELDSIRKSTFPLGSDVSSEELSRDPYPVFARLRAREPVSWIPAHQTWYVTTYDLVRTVLMDPVRFPMKNDRSTVFKTFGPQILSSDGDDHTRYRRATQATFSPAFVRASLERVVRETALQLLDEVTGLHEVELRSAVASRMPVRVIMSVCGLPLQGETRVRKWYDAFEAALENFSGDCAIAQVAAQCLGELYGFMDLAEAGLLSQLRCDAGSDRLSEIEIKRNVSIIMFGGISTVEALILNTLWALFEHPRALEQVCKNPLLLPQAIEETLRWLSPVQSAIRTAAADCELNGVSIRAGESLSCMLGAANHDPLVFKDPECFDIGRSNSRRHFAFATGTHACLGLYLAKAEGRMLIEAMLERFPRMHRVDSRSKGPVGFEFRQPESLTVCLNEASS